MQNIALLPKLPGALTVVVQKDKLFIDTNRCWILLHKEELQKDLNT